MTENPMVLDGLSPRTVGWAFSEFHASNWVPLTFVSLMADSALYGTGPRGYHTTNVLLHVANAVLLFLIALRLGMSPVVGSIIALLFALHPMRAESVAWVAERKDVLSTFFWLATTLFYVEWTRGGTRGAYALSLSCFALGLLSKGMLVTLPATLLLFDAALLDRRASWRRLIAEKIPYFALAAGAAAMTLVAQGTGTAVTDLSHLTIADRIANAMVGYATYPVRLLWPTDLAWYYPHPSFRPPYEGWSTLRVAGSVSLLLAVTVATVWSLRRGHRGPLAGWAFYLVTLLPVIGLVQVGMQATADRYTYVPQLGLIWLGAALIAATGWGRKAWLVPGLAHAIAGGVWTGHQLAYWRDAETLFRRAVTVTTDNGVAHKALGTHLVRVGRIEEGIVELREAVRIMPRLAEAHADLGIALLAAEKDSEAETPLRTALASLPDHAHARVALGNLLARRGDLAGATEAYRRAIEVDPRQWKAHLGLALIARARGRGRGREATVLRRRTAALEAAPDDEARQIIEERLR